MTDRRPRAGRRRTVLPTLVVTAATVGTTGLALAWSAGTAPVTSGSGSAATSAVALEIAREKTGIAQLHRSIAATMRQIDALQQHRHRPARPSSDRYHRDDGTGFDVRAERARDGCWGRVGSGGIVRTRRRVDFVGRTRRGSGGDRRAGRRRRSRRDPECASAHPERRRRQPNHHRPRPHLPPR